MTGNSPNEEVGVWLLGQFDTMVALSLFFVVFHLLLEKSQLRWSHAHIAGHVSCIVYSVLSGVGFLWATMTLSSEHHFDSSFSLLHTLSCKQLPNTDAVKNLLFVYYLSKIWEWNDIVLCLLRGLKLHPHFRIHHCTTLSLAWTFMETRSGHGGSFMLANLFMHTFVYLYHSSQSFRTIWLFWIIRIWGHVQLIVGVVGTVTALSYRFYFQHPCSGSTLPTELWDLALYLLYFGLFQYEISSTIKEEEANERDTVAEKKQK